MPADSVHIGWTTIEDGQPIPVRSAEPEPQHVSQPKASTMRLSAALGISVVLIGAVFTIGLDTLRGSLTSVDHRSTTITITADGHFSPTAVTVSPGSTLSIENKNADPQVIKVTSGNELFGAQVIFSTPFNFTVPVGVSGTFTYFSETLPEDRTVTITVAPAMEAGAIDIPIPFDNPQPSPTSSASSLEAPATLSVTPSAQESTASLPSGVAEPSNETAVISLGSATGTSSAETLTQGNLPTNPYTVATSGERKQNAASIASAEKKLHGGAPLQLMSRIRPRTTASTGPEGWLLLLFPALFALCVVYRKVTM